MKLKINDLPDDLRDAVIQEALYTERHERDSEEALGQLEVDEVLATVESDLAREEERTRVNCMLRIASIRGRIEQISIST